jgi:type II secretory pathway pseudopilin PulG
MRGNRLNSRGFTLIELVIIILIIGVIGTVAMLRMNETIYSAQYEQTKQEMDNLAQALVGNPEVLSDGARTDFGFVGDNGVLPSTMDDLVQNPGGWSTWDGPYMGTGLNTDDFKRDAWNSVYTLTDTLIRSTGSGGNIDKVYANSSSALLSNSVVGWVRDASGQAPTAANADLITVILNYPNGAGGMANVVANPSADGRFVYTGVPIGNHTLRVIFTPDSDTIGMPIAVYPGRDVSLDIIFSADLW